MAVRRIGAALTAAAWLLLSACHQTCGGAVRSTDGPDARRIYGTEPANVLISDQRVALDSTTQSAIAIVGFMKVPT